MRILVVGAGAIGGYFGGRLLNAGRDVTFLVRPGRAAQLAKTGLVIRSQFGNADMPEPPTVTADALRAPFDLILLSCKAYDLNSAIESFGPAVGASTAILPLLNGMAHIDVLVARFGGGAVLGGQCQISTTLDADGRVLHLNDFHLLAFGERDGSVTARAEAIAAALANSGFEARLTKAILLEMWEKWVLIAAIAGITCLMRAPIGDIVAANAAKLATAMLDECAAIAAAYGFAPRPAFMERIRAMVTTPGSAFAASMLRDMEHGARIEADHIIGDLIKRGEARNCDCQLLRIAYANLNVYEARRKREAAVSKAA
jgi:2-dehydropantoate 2-reductase